MQRQLIIPGTFLLLIGLLLGTVLDSFNSPAIASDAHVAGVQHGMLMILIGLAWSYSDPGRTAALSAYSIVVGLYGIWLAFLLGAVIGEAYPAESALTHTIFVTSSWVLIAGVFLFLVGLLRGKNIAHS